jgi:acetylornithine deacetylase/succinyl-diaminopimelate desuccinylase-like protein
MDVAHVISRLDGSYDDCRNELFELLRIPSISTRSEYRGDMVRAAEWLARLLRRAGFASSLTQTAGYPVIIGEWNGAGEHVPTVLLYGHYDVQPGEPLESWESPPFEPTTRFGRIYARGATDDKGQLFAHLKALETWLAVCGRLPVNVIVLIEGEEEVGSPHMADIIRTHADRLACDAVVISDSAMIAAGVPTIETSLRGNVSLEVEVIGPRTDLHSGEYGGAVINPAMALCRILAGLHDEGGRITVEGFYATVRNWTNEERQTLADLPFSEQAFMEEVGASDLGGEVGYSALERRWIRPAFDITGIASGYAGEGARSVLPARAVAKLSFRIVPDQDPDEITAPIEDHIRRAAGPGIHLAIQRLGSARPWRTHRSNPVISAGARALRRAFDREPVVVGGGGSIPVVTHLADVLGAPVLLAGFGSPGENAHAPNEWLSEESLRKGMHASAFLWQELATLGGAGCHVAASDTHLVESESQ